MSSSLSRIPVDAFPIPEDAADIILDTIRDVFGALLRHCHLVGALQAFAARDGKDEAPADVARAWKAAHRSACYQISRVCSLSLTACVMDCRLKRTLLLAYQAKLLEIRTAREKEARYELMLTPLKCASRLLRLIGSTAARRAQKASHPLERMVRGLKKRRFLWIGVASTLTSVAG